MAGVRIQNVVGLIKTGKALASVARLGKKYLNIKTPCNIMYVEEGSNMAIYSKRFFMSFYRNGFCRFGLFAL